MTSLFKGVGYCILTLTYIVVVAAAVVTLYPYSTNVANYINDTIKHHQHQNQQRQKIVPKHTAPGKCPCGPNCDCPDGTCPDACPAPAKKMPKVIPVEELPKK